MDAKKLKILNKRKSANGLFGIIRVSFLNHCQLKIKVTHNKYLMG